VLLLPGRAGAEAGRGGGGKDALFVELWKACAGPLSCVPPLGQKVYYLPQGHIEQVRQTGREGALAMPVSRYCWDGFPVRCVPSIWEIPGSRLRRGPGFQVLVVRNSDSWFCFL
jgi:hypothetical protein